MTTTYVELDANYAVHSEDQSIFIEVIIGNGQIGSYAIYLGRSLVEVNKTANLGTKSSVTGKNAAVIASIRDSLTETNWTSVILNITEGTKTTTYGPYEKLVANNFDTVIYTLKIHFS